MTLFVQLVEAGGEPCLAYDQRSQLPARKRTHLHGLSEQRIRPLQIGCDDRRRQNHADGEATLLSGPVVIDAAYALSKRSLNGLAPPHSATEAGGVKGARRRCRVLH